MPNAEHLSKLKAGVEEWNSWRLANPGLIIDLQGADCTGLVLHSVKLQKANCSRANLRGVDLRDANLYMANVQDANMQGANLTSAVLRGANLKGTNLRWADLTGSDLEGTNLDSADLRNTSGVRLNATSTTGAKFSPWATDPWSVLRRSYTGTRFAFVFVLLIAFFLPYLCRALFWSGVAEAEVCLIDSAIHFLRTAEPILEHSTNTQVKDWLQRLLVIHQRWKNLPIQDRANIADHTNVRQALLALIRDYNNLPGADRSIRVLDQVELSLSLRSHTRQVWQLLLGLDKGIAYSILVLTLLLYNIARGILTYRVGPLKEEEERSGCSPALRDYYYWPWGTTTLPVGLYSLHLLCSFLFVLAMACAAYNGYYWLSQYVFIPA